MASPSKSLNLDISISGSTSTLALHPGLEVPTTNDNEPPILEHGPHFRSAPLDYLKRIGLFVSGSEWRSYDNYIGRRVFYNGFSDEIKEAVMASPQLRRKMDELVSKRLVIEQEEEGILQNLDDRREELLFQFDDVARTMTDRMICKMDSKLHIRAACFLATQLLTRSYNQGIHVASEEVLRLRKVAEEAQKKQQSIIYLPRHTSHVDYIALQVICFRLGLSLPTVIAGDNLNFPLVGAFLQHAGAMWIRRSFGDDQLYTTLVQSYIDVLLQKGLNVECFIEGGRSRVGKLLPPKFGFLSFLLDSVVSGRVQDAVICPVSTQYDKVIEVDSYINELLGSEKQKENLAGFLSASSVLSLKLGRVDVRFHEPWSLREFVQKSRGHPGSLIQHQDASLQHSHDRSSRIRLLRTLGYKVLADINSISVVMPTALIGCILLTRPGNAGIGKRELVRRVDWLANHIRSHGGRVPHFAGLSTSAIVERGVEVLGPKLIRVRRELAEETYTVVDAFQLSFYRNMTIHLFVSQAIVCAACYMSMRQEQGIAFDVLKRRVSFLSQLFRGEFIFPTAGLMANLDDTLASLEKDSVIQVQQKPISQPDTTIDSISGGTSSFNNDDNDTTTTKMILANTTSETFTFYHSLITPFIECYHLASLALLLLLPVNLHSNSTINPSIHPSIPPQPISVSLPILLSHTQLLGRTLHAQGLLATIEAINKETLKNAFARFGVDGIITSSHTPLITEQSNTKTKGTGKVEAKGKGKAKSRDQPLCLAPDWLGKSASGTRSKVEAFVGRIAGYRALAREDGEGMWREEVRLVGVVRNRLLESMGVGAVVAMGGVRDGVVGAKERMGMDGVRASL